VCEGEKIQVSFLSLTKERKEKERKKGRKEI